jgi:hypothetical protein
MIDGVTAGNADRGLVDLQQDKDTIVLNSINCQPAIFNLVKFLTSPKGTAKASPEREVLLSASLYSYG